MVGIGKKKKKPTRGGRRPVRGRSTSENRTVRGVSGGEPPPPPPPRVEKEEESTTEEEEEEEEGGSHPIDEYLEYVQMLEKKHGYQGDDTTFKEQLSPQRPTLSSSPSSSSCPSSLPSPPASPQTNVSTLEKEAEEMETKQQKQKQQKEKKNEPREGVLLSLPPPLQSLDAVPEQAPDGVIVIENDDEMLTSAEYRQFSRPVRYFDEDASVGSTCFKCGLVGHFARDCPNPAKQRPCFLCATFGHSSTKCPNTPCFRCGESGHMARDCLVKLDSWEHSDRFLCRRCGTTHCRASGPGDVMRAEGKCNQRYSDDDLRMVTCMSCGHVGHANCTGLASTDAVPSCYNCGEMGHIGFECKTGPTPSVFSERRWSQKEYRRDHRRRDTHYNKHYTHHQHHQHHGGPSSRRPPPMQRLGVTNTWHKHVGRDSGLGPMKRATRDRSHRSYDSYS